MAGNSVLVDKYVQKMSTEEVEAKVKGLEILSVVLRSNFPGIYIPKPHKSVF
jgi:hypothetical protein